MFQQALQELTSLGESHFVLPKLAGVCKDMFGAGSPGHLPVLYDACVSITDGVDASGLLDAARADSTGKALQRTLCRPFCDGGAKPKKQEEL